MINTDTSESLFLSFPPSLSCSPSHAFSLSSRDKRHCVHPNNITCHTIFLFLTHSLPSHLSLSSNSCFFFTLPHVAAGKKSGCLSLGCSSFAPPCRLLSTSRALHLPSSLSHPIPNNFLPYCVFSRSLLLSFLPFSPPPVSLMLY